MALIKCRECSKEISSLAPSCPHCGVPMRVAPAAASAPAKRKTSVFTGLVAAFIGFAVLMGVIGSLFPPKSPDASSASSAKNAAPTKKKADPADLAKQPARKKLIDKMAANGLITKIAGQTDSPSVWVTPRFLAQDFDDKKSLMGAVYAYYKTEDPDLLFVSIIHTKTGKSIGLYNEFGLTLD